MAKNSWEKISALGKNSEKKFRGGLTLVQDFQNLGRKFHWVLEFLEVKTGKIDWKKWLSKKHDERVNDFQSKPFKRVEDFFNFLFADVFNLFVAWPAEQEKFWWENFENFLETKMPRDFANGEEVVKLRVRDFLNQNKKNFNSDQKDLMSKIVEKRKDLKNRGLNKKREFRLKNLVMVEKILGEILARRPESVEKLVENSQENLSHTLSALEGKELAVVNKLHFFQQKMEKNQKLRAAWVLCTDFFDARGNLDFQKFLEDAKNFGIHRPHFFLKNVLVAALSDSKQLDFWWDEVEILLGNSEIGLPTYETVEKSFRGIFEEKKSRVTDEQQRTQKTLTKSVLHRRDEIKWRQIPRGAGRQFVSKEVLEKLWSSWIGSGPKNSPDDSDEKRAEKREERRNARAFSQGRYRRFVCFWLAWKLEVLAKRNSQRELWDFFGGN